MERLIRKGFKMSTNGRILCALTVLAVMSGCVNPQNKAETANLKGISAQQVGTVDGALISEDIQIATMISDKSQTPEKTIIVQCPSCSQRVDVTGLPRDGVRCPNCNSLFTY